MRSDAKYSNRTVYCPNASTIGYGKYKAKRGDFIVYREAHTDGSHSQRMGRVLGTVDAPGFSYNGPGDKVEYQEPIKNHLHVFALADDAHTAYERYVHPHEVVMIYNTPHKFAAWFFQPELPYDTIGILRLSEYGTLSEHYIDDVDKRAVQLGIKKKKPKK